MKIDMPCRYRWLLRHCAIDLLILAPLGLVGEIVCRLVFPPHTIRWQAEGIDALMTAFWLAVIWLFSALFPLNAAQYGVDPKANPWRKQSEV